MKKLNYKLTQWRKKAAEKFAFWRFRKNKKIDYCHYEGQDYYRV